MERNDSDIIYKIALKLGNDEFLSYPAFVRVVDSYISFGRFDGVQDDGTVSKDEMIKELENASYPFRLDIKSVRLLFKNIKKD